MQASCCRLSMRVIEMQTFFFPFFRHLLRYKSTQVHTWYISLCTLQGRVSAAARDCGNSPTLTAVQCIPHTAPLAHFTKLFLPELTSIGMIVLVAATVSPVRVCGVV